MSDVNTATETAPATETTEATTETEAATPAEVQPEAPSTNGAGAGSDLNHLVLGDQVDDVDPEADADAVVLPPEHLNPFTFRLRLGKKGVYGPTKDRDGNLLDAPKISRDGKAFFVGEIEAYIVSEDPVWDGMRIFSFGDALMLGIYATSLVDKRTKASAAGDISNKTGYPFQKGQTVNQNADHFRQLLSAEPTIKGIIQWQATKETGEEDENGYPKRIVAVRGEKNFPVQTDKEGNQQFYQNGQPVHNARMEDPRDGTELVAKAVITRFLPVGE